MSRKRKYKKTAKRRRRTKGGFYFKNCDGIEYEVVLRKPDKRSYGKDVDGVCLNPDVEQPKIYINPYLTNQSELNTVIHEFAHAFFWNKTESEVTRFANAASRYLYNKRKWRKSEE